jgi:DNA-directed RNA polymerase
MPNLVHSLDAASLCIVINDYFNQDKIVVSSTPVKCSTTIDYCTNSSRGGALTNKAESITEQTARSAAPYPEDNSPHVNNSATLHFSSAERSHNNINFYSIHDCFAVPCNKRSKIIELLKTAYIIIYSRKKYLLEFEANFITAIKNRYGEDAVLVNEKEQKLTINTDLDSITVKYIPVKSIIDSEISKIDVSQSSYLAH